MAKTEDYNDIPNGTPDVPMEEENGIEESLANVSLSDFKIIGSLKRPEIKKIRRSLPQWMIQAQKFDGNIETNSCSIEEFQESNRFQLDDRIVKNLKTKNITKVFPVQRIVVPQLLESFHRLKYGRQPNDLWILSSTGSGKTLSYALPIMNQVLGATNSILRSLIILPVADLANQVYNVFADYCKGTHIRVGLATSGSTKDFISKKFMKNAYTEEQFCMIDILVATPGKLFDLLENEPAFSLRNLQTLVIDEADRMMNETQVDWLQKILDSVYGDQSMVHPWEDNHHNVHRVNLNHSSNSMARRTTPLFKILISATLTSDPEKLDSMSMFEPKLICSMNESVSNDTENKIVIDTDPRQSIPSNLKEWMIICEKSQKPLILWYLLSVKKLKKILCFTNSVESTHRLYSLLKSNSQFRVAEFHGHQRPAERRKVLKEFEEDRIDMIIATDVFARGLDINGIEYVICYDIPRNDTAYIHKIGRTARAGKDGSAITIVATDEIRHFGIISRKAHQGKQATIEKMVVPGAEIKKVSKEFEGALKSLQTTVGDEKRRRFSKVRHQIYDSKFTSNNKRRKVSESSTFKVESMEQA